MKTVLDFLRELGAGNRADLSTGEVTPIPGYVDNKPAAAQEAASSIMPKRGRQPEEEEREKPPEGSYQAALATLVNRPFLKTERYQEQQTRANWEGAHPAILDWHDWVQSKLRGMGIPMFAHSVVRTYEQQMTEFVDGDSKDSPADGYWPHKGTAIDLIHSNRGWKLTEQEWALIGHVGHEVARQHGLKLVWGGNDGPGDRFKWDPAHWEVANWRDVQHLYPWPGVEYPRTTPMTLVRMHRAAQRADMKKRFGG